jgi:predicted O-methyltransferase YrrM
MDRKRIAWGHLRRLLHHGPLTQLNLRAMAREQDPVLKRLAISLRKLVQGNHSDKAHQWFQSIEQVRQSYYSLSDPYASNQAKVVGAQTIKNWAWIGSKRPSWCRLLFELVSALEPQGILELGTMIGVSAAYQAAALECNARGKLVSIDMNAAALVLATDLLSKLQLQHRVQLIQGRFDDEVPSALATNGPFGLIFKDGAHTYEETMAYFEQFRTYAQQGPIDGVAILFDDITYSADMARAWKQIRRDPSVRTSIDFFNLGLVFIGIHSMPLRPYRIAP